MAIKKYAQQQYWVVKKKNAERSNPTISYVRSNCDEDDHHIPATFGVLIKVD